MMEMFGVDRAFAGIGLMILQFVFGWLIWIPVGAYVASQKRRRIAEGLILGFLGPFGAIIEALLPTKEHPENIATES